MSSRLEVRERIQHQTTDEAIIYSVTTTNWASSPTVGTVVVYDVGVYDETEETTDTIVTDDVMKTGSHGQAGDVISLKPLSDLDLNHIYRIEVQFAAGGSTYECYFRVKCTM